MPADYRPRTLTGLLANAYKAVFDDADRAGKNYLLASFAPCLHCRLVDPLARRADPRVTYYPADREVTRTLWDWVNSVAWGGPAGLRVVGSPDFFGRLVREYTVFAVPAGEVTVTDTLLSGSRTTEPTYAGGLSSAITLTDGLSVRVPSTGGSWTVTAIGKPRADHSQILARLEGTPLVLSRVTADPVLKTAWEGSGHTPERLGVMLVALADMIEAA